jgi:hypothetical protein
MFHLVVEAVSACIGVVLVAGLIHGARIDAAHRLQREQARETTADSMSARRSENEPTAQNRDEALPD